jgi:hypothetical protein
MSGLSGSRSVRYDIPVPILFCEGDYIVTVEAGDFPDDVISRANLRCEINP